MKTIKVTREQFRDFMCDYMREGFGGIVGLDNSKYGRSFSVEKRNTIISPAHMFDWFQEKLKDTDNAK